MDIVRRNEQWKFQSTPPARGATDYQAWVAEYLHISIHAPREGGDEKITDELEELHQFQSTPPARGATFRSGGL